jgi:hypothetical protein
MRHFLALALILLVVFLARPSLSAQEMPDSLEMQKQQEMMAEYMQLAQPGEEHQFLAKYAGNWDMEVKFWMTPDTEPMVSAGTGEATMILGGRFLWLETQTGQGMSAMESLWILGFDRRYKEFTAVGMDTFGTYYITAQGTMDRETNVLTLSGTDDDPIAGFTQVYDFVFRFENDDKYVIEMIFKNKEMTGGADSFKMGEITFTRQK